jgi:hypothetical protein
LEDARIETQESCNACFVFTSKAILINADLKSMRAAAQVVSTVMGREERR